MSNDLMVPEKIRVQAIPHPFNAERLDTEVPQGLSLCDILEIVQPDPVLRTYAFMFINDSLIPSSEWDNVYPFKDDVVTVRVVPMGGGGGGGGKNPLKAVMTIGVIAASFAFGPAVGAFLLPGVTATIGGTLLTTIVGRAIIGGVGMLASNALVPTNSPTSPGLPQLTGSVAGRRESPTFSIDGARNAERQFGSIPLVLGVHKHIPPLGARAVIEIVGNDQHFRMMVIWGYGRLKIDDLKIGNTAIAEFDDVEVETVEGVSGDPALTLFPDQISTVNFSVLLKQVDSWTTKTSDMGVDELSIDVIFLRGLVIFDNNGNRSNITVAFEINFRETGTGGSWLTPTFTAQTAPSSGDAVTVTDNKSSTVRHGFRWKVAARGQYDVRLRRTTADTTSTKIFDELSWVTLRSIVNEDPDQSGLNLAKTVIVVKATNQLSGFIDNLSATVSAYMLNFDGTDTWTEGLTANCAAVFRHVLQGDAISDALADSRLDFASLQAWWIVCDANNYEFDQVRDYESSVGELLDDICIAGRARKTEIDGKWGVIIDQNQTIPAQHFTNRTSWGFRVEKDFVEVPHALRVRFANRDQGWEQDERIVYGDGFSAANASRFEEVDALGMTDPEHIWKYARYNLAQITLRPERWFLSADFEYLVSNRGAMVLVTHDVLLVGSKAGRITALQVDVNGDITGFTSDETLTMTGGNAYSVSIRTVNDRELVRGLVLDVGDQTTIVFSAVIPLESAPVLDSLFGFGITDAVTIEGLIISVETQGNISALLTLVPFSSAIFDADTGTPPVFDTKLTPQAGLPDVIIIGVETDESILRLGAGDTIIPRIKISHEPLLGFDGLLKAQIRVSGSGQDFQPVTVSFQDPNSIIIEDIEQLETYDVRVQWTNPELINNGIFSFSNNIFVIGQSSPPSPLANITIAAYGGQALLRWDALEDLDVRFGGHIEFRHSHETVSASASWSESVSIGESAKGRDIQKTLPLKPGTYLARVFDKGGRSSTIVAIDTKQASVLTYANVDTVIEETAFSGTHTNTIAIGGILKLQGSDLMDSWGLVDSIVNWDSEGGVKLSGTYEFAAALDLGSVKKVRLTTDLNVVIVNVIDLIDSRTANIDTWESFDGDVSGAGNAQVQVRVTDDDPAGSPTWSAWNNLDSAEFENRGFEFRTIITTSDPAFNILISKLQVPVEEIA